MISNYHINTFSESSTKVRSPTIKVYVSLVLLLTSYACADSIKQLIPGNTAYGYLENIGIPTAEKIRVIEERSKNQRIIGGSVAANGQFEYQVGLLISIIGTTNRGVCGGSLISPNRVVTAAHCWYDGRHQAFNFEVVLGSAFLWSGGTRIQSSTIGIHPQWFPAVARNDVGVIYLPTPVSYSNTIGPVALPSGAELNENFAGETAVASGFGRTVEDGDISGNLKFVTLNIITNNVCRLAFPLILSNNNICTSGVGDVGTCRGDSGGPLVVERNGRRVMVGITSFGSGFGCESLMPAVYARVTSFIDFINSHL